MDPRFNLREAGRNMLLLEDHLFRPDLTCADCVKKHLNMCLAYLDEAISLDKDHKYYKEITDTNKSCKQLFKQLTTKMDQGPLDETECCNIAQEIRKIRKPLIQKYGTFLD